jgi:hypothetical protein
VADPVVDPAPSPSAPVVDPAAPAPAAADPAKPLVADPAKADPAKPVEPAKAPEKYDFTALKLPEGMSLDTARIAVVEPLLKEFGLSQENASKLVEAVVKYEGEAEAKREADFKEWMKTNITNYQTQLKTEWGAAHDANVVIAQKGMARVFSAEAKKLLDDTGLGNHPEFVKAFYQVGKMVSEDTPPNGQSPAGKKSNAEVFYGATQ